jgi:predicted dehydrogenase
LIANGAIGEVLTVRAREAHSGPHAPHFWDADTAGGGCLLDMGCHTVEAARYFLGKNPLPEAVFAWGATLQHTDKTTGEDNAVLLLRFAGGRMSISETSWTAKGGLELRNEVYGTEGRIVTDSSVSNITAFTAPGAGYTVEKADADTGWVFPIPDEARVYGYHEEMRHFVECHATGREPRETFVDGYVVNVVIDGAYRSMRSGLWETLDFDPELVG